MAAKKRFEVGQKHLQSGNVTDLAAEKQSLCDAANLNEHIIVQNASPCFYKRIEPSKYLERSNHRGICKS